MRSYVEIKGMRIRAHHGVLEQERRVGNLFEVTVRLRYDFTEPATTDTIDKAINYAEIVEIIRKLMSDPANLLETLAFRIKQHLTDRWPSIEGGFVSVAKLHPPFTAIVDRAEVSIEW